MLKLKLQYFGPLMQSVESLEKTLMVGGIGGRRKKGWQRMRCLDGITDRWTWVWVNSGSWWWTGRPGVLQFMGSQRVGHDWVTELNWTASRRKCTGVPSLTEGRVCMWSCAFGAGTVSFCGFNNEGGGRNGWVLQSFVWRDPFAAWVSAMWWKAVSSHWVVAGPHTGSLEFLGHMKSHFILFFHHRINQNPDLETWLRFFGLAMSTGPSMWKMTAWFTWLPQVRVDTLLQWSPGSWTNSGPWPVRNWAVQ